MKMKCILTILIMLNIFTNPISSATFKHPIYYQILKNKPNIDKSYAMNLSNVIYKMCKKYNLPKHIYTAILMQESNYHLDAVAGISGYYNGKVIKVKTDFGIAQIHWKNVKNKKLNIDKLLNDIVYSVEEGAKILSFFKKKYAHKEKDWWVRYNCGQKNIDRDVCQKYKKLVLRFL